MIKHTFNVSGSYFGGTCPYEQSFQFTVTYPVVGVFFSEFQRRFLETTGLELSSDVLLNDISLEWISSVAE